MIGPASPKRSAPEAGPLLFARFALPPNSLGYCGGDETSSLLQHVGAGIVDADLIRQCQDFEGAYPYLRLIAGEAGVADPLDRSVVEAYWLGGPALGRVGSQAFAADLTTRFRSRTPKRAWPWLLGKARSAVPHHSFHVLEVLPLIGMLRGGIPSALLPVLEQCLVRPARVTAVDGDRALIAAPRLASVAGKLAFLRSGAGEWVTWRVGATDLISDPHVDDRVAIHWGWVSDRLSDAQSRRLMTVTSSAISRANDTL
jgi:hypothetical protein